MYIKYCEDCVRPFESETKQRRLCDDCRARHSAGVKKNNLESVKKPKKVSIRNSAVMGIEDVAWLAKKAGMTYGKYVALHPEAV